jgi:hypothetical protein
MTKRYGKDIGNFLREHHIEELPPLNRNGKKQEYRRSGA